MKVSQTHERMMTQWSPRVGETYTTESGIEAVVCFVGMPNGHGHKNIITRPRLSFIDERGKVIA